MPGKAEPIRLIFSLAPDVKFEDALRALEEAKVEVTNPLAELGIILGKGNSLHLEGLRKLPHFQSVDADETVSIAPPDSPIQ